MSPLKPNRKRIDTALTNGGEMMGSMVTMFRRLPGVRSWW